MNACTELRVDGRLLRALHRRAKQVGPRQELRSKVSRTTELNHEALGRTIVVSAIKRRRKSGAGTVVLTFPLTRNATRKPKQR